MMLHSGAREVPLVIHYDDGTATKRLFSFPPGIRSRRVRIDLTRPPGEHLVVRSDSTCRIAGVRQIAAEWGIDRDCHLIYEGDLCIYENPCASSRGVCLDRDRVAVRGSSEGDMLELSRIEDVRSVECGECRLLSDEPEEILLDVRTARPCYLVFQDIHYPGWKAFADGAETEILKTDIGVRALELDQGAHKVAMVYRPASFKFGLILTCIGLVLTLLFSLGKRLSGSAGR